MALPGWAWLREAGPWRRVLAAGVGLLVLLGLGFGTWRWYEAAQARGASALADASHAAQEAFGRDAAPTQRDAAIRKLEDAIARHPSNQLVPQAAYHLGNLRYEARQWEAARAAYTLALARGARGALGSLCRIGIAYAWEAQGKYPEMLEAYQETVVRLSPTDFLYEEALMGLARAEELNGKPDRALETYRRILREIPGT